MDHQDKFDPVTTSSNGKALIVKETREGPPLEHVGDRLRRTLVYIHMAAASVNTLVPDNVPQPTGWRSSGLSVKNDGLLEPIRLAFRTQLTAFLSLYNMLALDGEELSESLLQKSNAEVNAWLTRIAAAGSVTG